MSMDSPPLESPDDQLLQLLGDVIAAKAVLSALLQAHPNPAKVLGLLLETMDLLAVMPAVGKSAVVREAIGEYRDLLCLLAARQRG